MRQRCEQLPNRIDWRSPISALYSRRPPKILKKLSEVGHKTLYDLIWIIPSRYLSVPRLRDFGGAVVGESFRGAGRVIAFRSRPNFYAKGRGRVMLQNVTMVVKDYFSEGTMELAWFNVYPGMVNKLKREELVLFHGVCKVFREKLQIVNPTLESAEDEDISRELQGKDSDRMDLQYPTVNGVSSAHIKRILDKISEELWETLPEELPEEILEREQIPSLSISFRRLHGKISCQKEEREAAKKRLIYEEFFQEQVKLLGRRKRLEEREGIRIASDAVQLSEAKKLFPYQLTADQERAIDDISAEITSGHTMMRLLQGDVGCGKTSVAVAALFLAVRGGYQGALMCPTESLAWQHFSSVQKILAAKDIRVELLLGSTSAKEKRVIKERLQLGAIDIVIGTHALIQESVIFYNLGMTVIDEQHKFGVNQRLRLASKGEGGHCLIMTATPIPRSLSLTRYGDLSLSVIKALPAGRKGTKTRIVSPENFGNFLNFLSTRMEMGEQIYIVVPAITEGVNLDLLNVEKVHQRFAKLFPQKTVCSLHGQMRSDAKAKILESFVRQEVDILIATSVIEVGINVISATVMAIFNPERFGLSSLHQLRGRVGRGELPGFCFLVSDRRLSAESLARIKVLERTTDGFRIAEEDLKIRGEGDLLGTHQSGMEDYRRLANAAEHEEQLLCAREDVERLYAESHPYVVELVDLYRQDHGVAKTI